MINFQCSGKSQDLNPGEWFSETPQEALFTDTPSETLRRLTAEIETGSPWQLVVDREYATSNPWLHRIIASPKRDLFFRTHGVFSGKQILDVGSGWGQQALALAKTNFVCAVEPNPDRLGFIRAVARQTGTLEQLGFINADLLSLDFGADFDAVTCIGVLEWAANFNRTGTAPEAQREFLRRLYAALKSGGQCVIGIENRLGLKYLLGARDDHTGTSNLMTLDYRRAKERWNALRHHDLRVVTYSQAEYRELLHDTGFAQIQFYAAFPDYKLPDVILPCDTPEAMSAFFQDGGFFPEHDGWDGSPLPESMQAALASHYASFAEMEIAHHFAPSFFIVARK